MKADTKALSKAAADVWRCGGGTLIGRYQCFAFRKVAGGWFPAISWTDGVVVKVMPQEDEEFWLREQAEVVAIRWAREISKLEALRGKTFR